MKKYITAQMKEMAYIGFYVWYFLEWLLCLLVSGFSFGYAYHDISLEEEAHLNDKNLEIFKNQKTLFLVVLYKIRKLEEK